MYRSPKEQRMLLPELQLSLGSGRTEEAAALLPSGLADGEAGSAFSSVSEQLKRTMRKTSR
ncbi:MULTISPECIES: hypothetical protein [Paenibacillus]|uniref:Uncharacterized protein n=1 Tax=Paenibacillus naphthalenovorans TaxID=162209 RepID=A0A0U2UA79_9BACL|nr:MULTISPECIES: hypothetical protein [Paenibacillus]ALS23193.1 hypothetical protein IJ22_28200 [Paenibacillus naphthalenovorans]NTZ17219.1 hypothetical protein [Paenibacillus sp. JMULE4]GCL71690.1 hypothetical protein PN4B1_15950 [Paenibacillus naphthalenovorans]SDI13297.1 hypothetical protein SAMN05421868_103219 [Paenibacillus naphthalenovorans]